MINLYIYQKILGDALILPIAFSQTEQIRLLINVDEKITRKTCTYQTFCTSHHEVIFFLTKKG